MVSAQAAESCGKWEVGLGLQAFLLFSLSRNDNKNDAALAKGFDKYLKMKNLDQLDTYVPTVLLAQSQLQEVDGKLDEEREEKKYDGPGASSAAVDQRLSALEDVDSLLLQASRSQGAPVERMRKDLTMTVTPRDIFVWKKMKCSR